MGLGGATLHIITSGNLAFSGINNFISLTHADFGGAICAGTANVALTFNGTNNFINNSAEYRGWWCNLCKNEYCT